MATNAYRFTVLIYPFVPFVPFCGKILHFPDFFRFRFQVSSFRFDFFSPLMVI